MRLNHTRRSAFVAVLSLTVMSCGQSTTSPATKALDGTWTTGHACLTLGFTLTWTREQVQGTGTYRTDGGPIGCSEPSLDLRNFGDATLSAARLSATVISGSLSFDSGSHGTFTGTLTGESPFSRVEGLLLEPDGSTIPVTLFQGAVP